ncbi:YdcH family protein [Ferrimonas senticii]|uniref:YdcH family protein n=1 Tax=Ferrimonas senticii TaxID=394566 RepID=UPI00040DA9E0|nr:YdcH family protein [Ferrimonas senticii]
MLGEVHSLVNDFPEHQAVIESLLANDPTFAQDTKQYNALDKEIRTLELNNSPIGDDQMHKLKHDRAELKDSLYQRITAAAS